MGQAWVCRVGRRREQRGIRGGTFIGRKRAESQGEFSAREKVARGWGVNSEWG